MEVQNAELDLLHRNNGGKMKTNFSSIFWFLYIKGCMMAPTFVYDIHTFHTCSVNPRLFFRESPTPKFMDESPAINSRSRSPRNMQSPSPSACCYLGVGGAEDHATHTSIYPGPGIPTLILPFIPAVRPRPASIFLAFLTNGYLHFSSIFPPFSLQKWRNNGGKMEAKWGLPGTSFQNGGRMEAAVQPHSAGDPHPALPGIPRHPSALQTRIVWNLDIQTGVPCNCPAAPV